MFSLPYFFILLPQERLVLENSTFYNVPLVSNSVFIYAPFSRSCCSDYTAVSKQVNTSSSIDLSPASPCIVHYLKIPRYARQ